MQRMFLALVADMRRLGAQLVSANFNGVLICTGKRNMSAAGAFFKEFCLLEGGWGSGVAVRCANHSVQPALNPICTRQQHNNTTTLHH